MVKSQNISPEQMSYSVLVLFAILLTEEFKKKKTTNLSEFYPSCFQLGLIISKRFCNLKNIDLREDWQSVPCEFSFVKQ